MSIQPALFDLPDEPGTPPGPALAAPSAPREPAPPRWHDVLGVFDLETTGVDVAEDRIVTAHVGVIGPGGVVQEQRSWLADPGIEIPEGASAIHGITTAHARTHGADPARVTAEIVEALAALLARGIPVVAYNAPFDFSLLKHEALRHGIRPIEDPAPIIDPLVLDKGVDRYRRGKRTLDVVAAHYAVLLEAAHDAAADAVAAGRVAQALIERYADRLPGDALAVHERQIAWARAQAESLSEYFVRIGRLDPSEALDGSWPVR